MAAAGARTDIATFTITTSAVSITADREASITIGDLTGAAAAGTGTRLIDQSAAAAAANLRFALMDGPLSATVGAAQFSVSQRW